ncbi:MAG: lipid kinase [Oscillatoria sp. PMC 1068.18]|nr:lipid kinase [Oscillatoria sp. PMC 1076.18]MEC4987431.1 lipid kinase [Oscillatoria sp. PMC 1068.18]
MSLNKTALLIVNRHSRNGKQHYSEIIQHLESLGFTLVEDSPKTPQELPDLICSYRDRVDLVIIGGGDGTLNMAIDGLLATKLPLGIIPLGTANDLAKTLGIPVDLTTACEAIAKGKIKQVDLGEVNGKHFFNVASLGLSVKITKQLTKENKRRWGVFAYAATSLKVISKSLPFRAKITINGETINVRTVQIAVGNGRYYGGGMQIAYDATIDDQRLDLYSLEVKHWWQIIALFPALWLGRHPRWLGIRLLTGQEIMIETKKHRQLNTDGEITTKTPAKFRVIPRALEIIIPQ